MVFEYRACTEDADDGILHSDTLNIKVTNLLNQSLTIHWHGVCPLLLVTQHQTHIPNYLSAPTLASTKGHRVDGWSGK